MVVSGSVGVVVGLLWLLVLVRRGGVGPGVHPLVANAGGSGGAAGEAPRMLGVVVPPKACCGGGDGSLDTTPHLAADAHYGRA